MSEHSVEAYGLGWSMFLRRCTLDGSHADEVDAAWLTPQVREFWMDEAQAVLDYQARTTSLGEK